MGQRGPVPQRTELRRRRNMTGTDRAPAATKVVIPAANREWHPIARRWYQSLRKSGQSIFYEPSDWAQAYFIAETMSRLLEARRFSAQLFAAIDSAAARLMVTEGDRRRLRLELDHGGPVDEDEVAGVASMDKWREKLTAGATGGGSGPDS